MSSKEKATLDDLKALYRKARKNESVVVPTQLLNGTRFNFSAFKVPASTRNGYPLKSETKKGRRRRGVD